MKYTLFYDFYEVYAFPNEPNAPPQMKHTQTQMNHDIRKTK